MAERSGPTVRRRRLGAELRRMREAKGLTVDEAATVLRSTGSRISRMERGHFPFRARDVEDLLDAYDVTDQESRAALLALVKETRQRAWWHSYGDVVPRWFQVYIGLEAEASHINIFEGLLVPGLLQTADYARAVFRAASPAASDEEVQRAVDVRLDRQKILSSDPPAQLWAVLDEAVIRRVVGGSAVMREQLTHLVTMSERPSITIQMIPFGAGAHAGMGASFRLLGFADTAGEPEMVYIEAPTGSLYLERPADVDQYRSWMEQLRAAAYDEQASRGMLMRAIEGMRDEHIQ